MLDRALVLATVTLVIGCSVVAPGLAQAQNLDAGKSPSQIFSGTCTACHKSARGLLKTVPAGSLQSFLRQQYTTSPEMAGGLSSYLISNGAAGTRYSGGQSKQDTRSPEGRRMRAAAPSQGAAGSVDGAAATNERGPDGRKSRSKHGKRGKPDIDTPPTGESANEPPKADSAKDAVR